MKQIQIGFKSQLKIFWYLSFVLQIRRIGKKKIKLKQLLTKEMLNKKLGFYSVKNLEINQ
jgi:hypothetical protein